MVAESLRSYIRLRWEGIRVGTKLKGEEDERTQNGNERLIVFSLGVMSELVKLKESAMVLSELKEAILMEIVPSLLATTEIEK